MHQPANTFSAQHESRGEDTANSAGTLSNTNSGANNKTAWQDLGSVTSFTYEGFTIYISSGALAGDFVVDIGISDGSNRFIIVPDLHSAQAKQLEEHNMALFIPVHVPSGSQLSFRQACSVDANDLRLLIVGHRANPGGFPGYSRAVALFSPSSSRGVTVDPGGTANTNGSWAQLTASCPDDVAAIFGVIGFAGDTARSAASSMNLQIGVGAGGSEQLLIEGFCFSWGATWDGPNDVFFQSITCSIPSGVRIAARARCTDNTAGDRTCDLALYGLVR